MLGGTPGRIDYRYDRIGNMLAQSSTLAHVEKGLPVTDLGDMESGGAANGRSNRNGRAASDPPGPHALTRITGGGTPRVYDYDANGNMLTIDGMTCTWDFKDRLIAVENTEMRAEYSYDYTDRRITKRVTPKQSGSPVAAAAVTHYINRYFEVRDYDQPVKYVWQGETRVARVTGRLTASTQRMQKLRLRKGWNLVALAVAGSNAQLDPATHPIIDEAVWWSATGAASGYAPIRAAGTSVPAGVPAWLFANAASVITIAGPAEPAAAPASLAAGGQFVANASADAWSLAASFPPDAEIWSHLAGTGLWLPRLSGADAFLSDSSVTQVLPGESVFVRAAAAAVIGTAPAALQIRYYHQDHLGSSSAITDQSGVLVEETANYPFGHPRSQHRPAGLTEPYGFTQKERDGETGLHYFEARYLSGRAGRFASVDKILVTAHRLATPQSLNFYSYCRNNPICRLDPGGNVDFKLFAKGAFDAADGVYTAVQAGAAIGVAATVTAGSGGLGTGILVVTVMAKTGDLLAGMGQAVAGVATMANSFQSNARTQAATQGQIDQMKSLTSKLSLKNAVAHLAGIGAEKLAEHNSVDNQKAAATGKLVESWIKFGWSLTKAIGKDSAGQGNFELEAMRMSVKATQGIKDAVEIGSMSGPSSDQSTAPSDSQETSPDSSITRERD